MSGLSKHVIESRNALILSQIEEHAPNKERYTLIAKVVNVGVALLVPSLSPPPNPRELALTLLPVLLCG